MQRGCSAGGGLPAGEGEIEGRGQLSQSKLEWPLKVFQFTGQAILWLLALALTVGSGTAISNGRSWIDLVRGTAALGWLANPQVRIFLVALVFFSLGWMVRKWWAKLRANPPTSAALDPYDLYDRMDSLAAQIKDCLRNEGSAWLTGKNQYELATDCYSFNTTLQKAGFIIPDVTKLNTHDRLAVFAYFYLNVGPFLRDGHVVEARVLAADLGPKAVAQVEQGK